jgi:predicted ATPase
MIKPTEQVAETLEIINFLSIIHTKFEFRQFNIITGDTAAGKSLCIKLLKFFQDVIPDMLVSSYGFFNKNLDSNDYHRYLAGKFTRIFTISFHDPAKQKPFSLNYTFSYGEGNNKEIFDMTVTGSKESDVVVKSSYMEGLLQEWKERLYRNLDIASNKGIVSEKEDDEIFKEFKHDLSDKIQRKFGGHFPITTAFIPASRAALTFGSNHKEHYLENYNDLLGTIRKKQGKNSSFVDKILKAKIEEDNSKEEGNLFLKSKDGRKISIAKASSGQQEIVYVLMHLDRLGNGYKYSKVQSVFIEEPSAHLFPQDQMYIINFIAQVYNDLKGTDNPSRFFITTHSPYVLNSINNILKKGTLLKKHPEAEEKINKTANIPTLTADEVSAYFIHGDDGKEESIMDESEEYLYSEKIAKISFMIDEIDDNLSDLQNTLQDKRG